MPRRSVDAECDGAPVIALTGSTYHDMGGTHHTQDVDLVSLFKDVALYDELVLGPAHAMTVTDLACRTALAQRGVAHLSVPIDIQGLKVAEEKVSHTKGKRPTPTSLPAPTCWTPRSAKPRRTTQRWSPSAGSRR
ncbi:MAG TPA: hypothetical protein VH165_06830 [Kofleriaceae bacterium]|jgi:pyruvate dehydrogenase (quinone)/pyruvate decarboxylase|nr:hypothetical protein [Kofleriaceae bacterium]